MMNRYLPHPAASAVGEAENRYARREDRGWVLEKRGRFFDRYHWGTAVSRQYRVEIGGSSPKSPDWEFMQIRREAYLMTGWREIPARGMVRVYSAPIGCPEPMLYEDPSVQKSTIRVLKARGWSCSVLAVLVLCALAAGILLLFTESVPTITPLWLLLAIRHPAEGLLVMTVALGCIWILLRAGIRNLHLARRLKQGKGILHGRAHPQARQIFGLALAVLCAAFVICIGIQKLQENTEVLPRQADGAYLLLQDMGVTGKRLMRAGGGEISTCLHEKSILAECWETEERITSGSQRITLQQYAFRLSSRALTRSVAAALLQSHGIQQTRDYAKVDVPGLDAAWAGNMDCVAIRGSDVYYVRYLTFDGKDAASPVLEALAALQG